MKRLLVLTVVTACSHPAAPRPAGEPAADKPAENSQALADQGTALFEQGKLDEADRALQRAGDLGNADAWGTLAYVRVYRGDEAAMWKAFDKASDLVGKNRDLSRAWMLFALGKLDEARALATAEVGSVRKEVDAQDWAKAPMLEAGLLIELGRYREAIAPLELALQRVPEAGLADHPYFRTVPVALLAWAKAGAHDASADATGSTFDAIAAAHPGDPVVAAFLPIVHAELALAHSDTAAAERALSTGCDGAMCLEHLAEVQTLRGETAAATATRAKIKTLFRASPPAAYYWHKAQR